MKRIRLLLIPVLLITMAIDGLAQPSATITPGSALTEIYLDTQYVDLVLVNDSFVDYSTLHKDTFRLVNAPPGLTIQSLANENKYGLRINMAFNHTDFDVNYTNFRVAIRKDALYESPDTLKTNAITIYAGVETAGITPDATLGEYDLDARSLNLTLSDERFTVDNYDKGSFTLVNAPSGLSIDNLSGKSFTNVTINLLYDDTDNDFDTDYTNFRVEIDQDILVSSSASLQTSPADTVFAVIESASMVPDQPLDEYSPDLDQRYLTITLSGEDFISGGFDGDRINLVNAPAGVTKGNVTRLSATTCKVELNYNDADFDVNVTDFHISLDGNNLQRTLDNDTIFTDNVTVTAYVENPSVTITPDQPLNENGLEDRSLAVKLSDCKFSGGSANTDDIKIRNYPPGVTYTISGVSDSVATVNLNFDDTDFDVNYTSFYVWIDGSNLTFKGSVDSLNSNQLTITAVDEPPAAYLTSTPSDITEANINGAVLHITLDQETFNDTMTISEFTMVNEPIGTTLTGFEYVNNTQVNLTLSQNGTDFDDDISDFRIDIAPAYLTRSSSTLPTDNKFIDAEDEPAVATFSPDMAMEEYNLQDRTLLVTVQQDTFLTLGSRPVNEFDLDNEPAGLVISSVTVINKNQAQLDLDFTYNDFDSDITNFRVIVKPDNLEKRTTDLNTQNTVTITHYLENPEAFATEDAELIEFTLDDRYVDIALTDEWFPNTDSVLATDFTLLNKPDGLTVEGIASISKYAVRLSLAFNGTDFDIHYNDFRVSINKDVLIQSGSDLVTDAMSIEPTHEPIITNIDIPDHSHKVGDVVAATITLDTDVDTMFTRQQGNIGGYAIDSLTRHGTNFDTYFAWITINEGGTDYAANVDIPVNSFQMKDGVILGNIYSTPIANDNDLIDAHTPIVSSILMISQGFQKVGNQVFMVVGADDKNYSVDGASVINSQSTDNTFITVTDNGNNTYTFKYTIQEGHDDVDEGLLTAGFVFSDVAGNKNVPYTTISANDVSIDANAPVVDSIKITSPDTELTIGETLDITIYADGINYPLDKGSTLINGVEASHNNIFFEELSGGEYRIYYTIQEGDNEVTTPGGLAVAIVIADLVGNKSDPPETNLLNNNVTILTTKPTANLSGTQNICLGDTAELNITFTGVAPWNVVYTANGINPVTIEGITDNPFYFDVITESAKPYTYTITNVEDATGNNKIGTGSAFLNVYSLPEVKIVDLDPIHSVDGDDVLLIGDPPNNPGGQFLGPGVNHPDEEHFWFSPSEAGVTTTTPHKIIYIYEDINGCVNDTFANVTVLSASANIFIGPDGADARTMACWYEDEFVISAKNTVSKLGSFEALIGETPITGSFLTDHSDNTATLNPMAFDWDTIQHYLTITLVYSFTDNVGVPISEERDLHIEFFKKPIITGFELEEDKEFCSNLEIIPLTGNYNITTPKTGVFTLVQGVAGDLAQGYTFNPATANLGDTWITYTQQQTAECVLKDSVLLTVHPSPIADFQVLDTCIAAAGSQVNFGNTTDTATLGLQMESWAWDFGDFFANFSDKKDPSHFYSVGGSRTIKLEATTIHGCFDDKEQVFTFGAEPIAGFKWNTECFTGDSIKFKSLAQSDDPISEYTWRLYNPDGTLLNQESGSNLNNYAFKFTTRDEYPVDITVLTERNCYDSFRDTILLRPYINVRATDDPYFEDFEGDPPGWYSSKDEINAWGSWTFDPVTSAIFPKSASSGSHAWYTVLAHSDSIEQSWVSSPCFNLKQTRRPMIRMNIKRSMERDRDGAVLQYTADNGTTWNNVGTLDDGSINWFNSFRITPNPGEQEQGWTGDFTFTPDQNWVIAKHELDELRQYPVVQFRIAYGSYGKSDVVNNKGFAFDDIWIGERSRLVLLEHFTNASDELSKQANIQVNNLVDENKMDIIDINYHVGDLGIDKMYNDYPIGPSARSLYYGISSFPQSFIDGGGELGTFRYNYIGTDLDELDLFTRVLEDPSFNITLDANVSGGQLSVDVTVEALEDLAQANYTVHIAVIEKEITDADYTGGSGLVFQNVVKQMLPDAGGSIFTRSWTTGDQETVSSNWTFNNVLNEEMIYVVAFIQNRETKVVYQTVTNDPDANATSIESFMAATKKDILVYPNPSSEIAYIAFGKPVDDRTELKVYNHAGALIGIHLLEGGLNVYPLNVSDYKKGVYYIRVTDQMKVVGTAKLIVL